MKIVFMFAKRSLALEGKEQIKIILRLHINGLPCKALTKVLPEQSGGAFVF